MSGKACTHGTGSGREDGRGRLGSEELGHT